MTTQAEQDLIAAALAGDLVGIATATASIKIEREPVLRPSVEESLRATAADWQETAVGHAYAKVVLEILDGKRT